LSLGVALALVSSFSYRDRPERRPSPSVSPVPADDSPEFLDYWPQWRGPLATGVAPRANPPLEWSEDKNIRWKVAVPGRGHSTPVVWADRIFLTTAIPSGAQLPPPAGRRPGAHDGLPVVRRQSFVVLAVNRRDGTIAWQTTVREQVPNEGIHYTGSFASNSPVVDGEHVFAFFGSYGLYCIAWNGKLVWETDLGDMDTKHGHGEGSSLVLHEETLIVNWDHEGQSFVVAFDKRTGKERWKVERDEPTSWATPIVIEHHGKHQVIVSGTNRVRGYDLSTGEVIWECGGLSANVVASPVAADGMVYAGSSYDTRNLLAIHLDGATGDITGTDRVAWTRHQGTPYVPSLLLYEDALYFVYHYQGILTRLDAATGDERPGPMRLAGMGNIYASPVAAGGHVYITDLEGATLVLTHDDNPKALARNVLEDRFSASAAIAGSELFLRGEGYLYSIAEEQATR
jgi:outer membrane protein assembly factor BamB